LVVCTSAAWAGDAGTTSANFLKLGVGPRAEAMGEAQVAVADDVYATYWNPAGLAQLDSQEAGFVQSQYFQDIHEEYAAYAHPTERWGTFAGAITYLGVGNFQGFDAVGQPTGDVSAHDTAFSFSYAKPIWQDRRMGSQFSVGANGKWIQESLAGVSASAYAIDAGVLFKPGHRWGEWAQGLRTGLTLRNVGTAMTFDNESFTLPRSLTAGVSYTGLLWNESVTVATDFQQPNDGARVLNAGIEVATLDIFLLRAGYTTFSDIGSGFRVGGGLRFKTLEVDYAFTNGGELGDAHRFGIVLHFGKPPPNPQADAQRLYERGVKEYHTGHYTDAMLDFNKALQIDPGHPHAYDMMQKTYENLKAINPQ